MSVRICIHKRQKKRGIERDGKVPLEKRGRERKRKVAEREVWHREMDREKV